MQRITDLILIALFLFFFLHYVFAANLNDFKQRLDLNISSKEELPSGSPVIVFLDTLEQERFDFNKACLQVSFKGNIIGRKIENFNSSNTLIKFNLVEPIKANALDVNYALLAGCKNNVDENNFFVEKFNDLSTGYLQETSSSFAVQASVVDGPKAIIYNPATVASGNGYAKAILTEEIKRYADVNSYYSFYFDTTSSRDNCITVTARISILSQGENILWQDSMSSVYGDNSIKSGSIEIILNWQDENHLSYSVNGNQSSITLNDSYNLQIYIDEVRGAYCNTTQPTSYLLHERTLTQDFVRAIYSTDNGSAGNGWNYIAFKSEFEFLSPRLNSVMSAVNDSDFISFSLRDLDEKESLTADIYFHFLGEQPFAHKIVNDLNLNDLSFCNDSDNNLATIQDCFFDWNSFSVNDKNVFIDLRVKDTYFTVEKSSENFLVDNLKPQINLFSIESFHGTGYTNNEMPQMNINVSDVTDFNSIMSFSCNQSNWTSSYSLSNTFNDFNFLSSAFGCSEEQGLKTVFIKVCDAFNLCSEKEAQIIFDSLPPIAPTLKDLNKWNDSNSVFLDWTENPPFDESGLFLQQVFLRPLMGEWLFLGNSSFSENTFLTNPLVDNNYFFKVRVFDVAGNYSESNIVSTIIDFSLPELLAFHPDANTTNNYVEFLLHDVSGINVNSVFITFNDLNESSFNSVNDCMQLNEQDLNCAFNEIKMPEGLNFFRLQAADNKGLRNFWITPTFYFDLLPVIESQQLEKGAINMAPVNFITIDTWPGGIDFNSLALIIDSNTQLSPDINSCVSIVNGFSCFIDFGFTEEKNYFIEIQAKSIIGQPNSRLFNVFFDKTIPSIEIISPSNNTVVNSSNVLVNYAANDNYLLQYFEVKLDNSSWFNNQLNTSFSFSNLSNGIHEIKVKAVDLAGNEAVDSVVFTVSLQDNDSTTKTNTDFTGSSSGPRLPSDTVNEDLNAFVDNNAFDSFVQVNEEPQKNECSYDFPFSHSFFLNKEMQGEALPELHEAKEFDVIISFIETNKLKIKGDCNKIKAKHYFIVFVFNGRKFAIEFLNNLIVSFFELDLKANAVSENNQQNNLSTLLFLPEPRLIALIPFALALLLLFIVFKKRKRRDF